jgi:hypothetical protein
MGVSRASGRDAAPSLDSCPLLVNRQLQNRTCTF